MYSVYVFFVCCLIRLRVGDDCYFVFKFMYDSEVWGDKICISIYSVLSCFLGIFDCKMVGIKKKFSC